MAAKNRSCWDAICCGNGNNGRVADQPKSKAGLSNSSVPHGTKTLVEKNPRQSPIGVAAKELTGKSSEGSIISTGTPLHGRNSAEEIPSLEQNETPRSRSPTGQRATSQSIDYPPGLPIYTEALQIGKTSMEGSDRSSEKDSTRQKSESNCTSKEGEDPVVSTSSLLEPYGQGSSTELVVEKKKSVRIEPVPKSDSSSYTDSSSLNKQPSGIMGFFSNLFSGKSKRKRKPRRKPPPGRPLELGQLDPKAGGVRAQRSAELIKAIVYDPSEPLPRRVDRPSPDAGSPDIQPDLSESNEVLTGDSSLHIPGFSGSKTDVLQSDTQESTTTEPTATEGHVTGEVIAAGSRNPPPYTEQSKTNGSDVQDRCVDEEARKGARELSYAGFDGNSMNTKSASMRCLYGSVEKGLDECLLPAERTQIIDRISEEFQFLTPKSPDRISCTSVDSHIGSGECPAKNLPSSEMGKGMDPKLSNVEETGLDELPMVRKMLINSEDGPGSSGLGSQVTVENVDTRDFFGKEDSIKSQESSERTPPQESALVGKNLAIKKRFSTRKAAPFAHTLRLNFKDIQDSESRDLSQRTSSVESRLHEENVARTSGHFQAQSDGNEIRFESTSEFPQMSFGTDQRGDSPRLDQLKLTESPMSRIPRQN